MLKNSRELLNLLRASQTHAATTNALARRTVSTSQNKQGGGGGGGGASGPAAHDHSEPQPPPPNASTTTIASYFKFPANPIHERRGWLYREVGNLQRPEAATAGRALMVIVWWWIFYNLWAHWENVVGHFPYPDTSKWTDEELGIPPDDAE
jgi:hypothetical protein